jgi:2-polyprenyl-3-methyl-5-hydroxy-6-metoxy-1,4-benzoquinol methylase
MSIFSLLRPLVPERVAIRLRPYRKVEAHASDHGAGKWNYLDGLEEFARYSIIAGYYARLRPQGSVLDLGCGAGLMQRTLVPYNYSRYLGIDISPDAIERASCALHADAQCPNTMFQVGSMEQNLDLNHPPFDVIIINEALCYTEQPVEVLSRLYKQVLAPEGIFIISLHHTLNSQRLWRLLARRGWQPTDVTKVSNKAGITWTVRVFAMGPTKDGNAA